MSTGLDCQSIPLIILEPLNNEDGIAIIAIDFAKISYFIDQVLILSVSTECM